MLRPKKIHTRNLITKKIPAARKFPSPHNFSNGPSLSVISKRRYLTVNRRTGIMIDLGVAVFVQTEWFALLSLRVALERLH